MRLAIHDKFLNCWWLRTSAASWVISGIQR